MNKATLIILSILFINCGSLKETINYDSEEPKLVWDFDNENKFVYSMISTVSSEFKNTKNSPLLKSTIVENGNVIVQAKSNKLADFSIANLTLNYRWFEEDGSLKDSSSFTMPTSTIKDIQPNGTFGESEIDMYFKLLMPLPSSNIRKGESYKVSFALPLEDYPESFNEGFNTITFAEVKKVQGRKCAILKGVLNIANLKLTKNLEGNYKQQITGITTHYFDIEKHCFIGVDIKMVENTLNELKFKNTELEGVYSMLSKKIIRIRLDGVADF